MTEERKAMRKAFFLKRRLSKNGEYYRTPPIPTVIRIETKKDIVKDEHYQRSLRAARYKISVERLIEMETGQNGLCLICKRKFRWNGKNFVVDHCHKTGRVRGLLCPPCNIGIGMLGDSPENLEAAAIYLRSGAPAGAG